jgi:hypothetical protein
MNPKSGGKSAKTKKEQDIHTALLKTVIFDG